MRSFFFVITILLLAASLPAQEGEKIRLLRTTNEKAAIEPKGEPTGEPKGRVTTPVSASEIHPTGPTEKKATRTPSMVDFSGYFRMMARDDFGAGSSTLGYQPAQGRLMNETPWLMLGVTTHLMQSENKRDIRSDLFFRVEGGSFRNSDSGFGSLANYRFTLLYLTVENAVFNHSHIQVGSIWYNMGYIGMYDAYVSQLFWETVGLRVGQKIPDKLEYFIAVGDSGYSMQQERLTTNTNFSTVGYNTTPTVGALVKYTLTTSPIQDWFRWADAFQSGAGFQLMLERSPAGSPNAPYQTPGINYIDVIRGEALENWLLQNPGLQDYFPNAVNRSSPAWKASLWLGFNLKDRLGPMKLMWNDMSFSFVRKRADRFVDETYNGITKRIYTNDFTDERYEFIFADEMQWQVWKDRLDINLGTIMIFSWDKDNVYKPSEANRNLMTFTVRPQFYMTSILHALLEVSYTTEFSTLGNLYREHYDSIEASTAGSPDMRGLEYGDTNRRNSLQIKLGPVLNPNGRGIYNRPTIRLLFGMQFSNVHAAFPNNYSPALNSNNVFSYGEDRHEHYMVSLEVEHWWN